MRALGLLACAGLAACTTSKPPAAPTTNGLDGSLKVVEVTPDGQKLPVSADGVTEVDVDSTLQVSVDGDKVTGAASGIVPQVSKQLTALGARMKELRALVDAQREVLTVLTEVLPKATKEGFHAALKEVAKKEQAVLGRVRAYCANEKEAPCATVYAAGQASVLPFLQKEIERAKADEATLLGRLGGVRFRVEASLGGSRAEPLHLPNYDTRPDGPIRPFDRFATRLPAALAEFEEAKQLAKSANELLAGNGKVLVELRATALTLVADLQNLVAAYDSVPKVESKLASVEKKLAGSENGKKLLAVTKKIGNQLVDAKEACAKAIEAVERPTPDLTTIPALLSTCATKVEKLAGLAPDLDQAAQLSEALLKKGLAELGEDVAKDLKPLLEDLAKVKAAFALVQEFLRNVGGIVGRVDPTWSKTDFLDQPLSSIPNTSLELMRTSRAEKDVVFLRPSLVVDGTAVVEGPTSKFRVVRVGSHADLSGALLFVTPNTRGDRSDGSKEGLFAASPALTLAYHYRVGRAAGATSATGLGALWNLLDLGLGLHAVTLALPRLENGKAIDTTSIQLGLGPVLQVFGDVVQLGWGYDIQAERSYWFFGLGLKTMTDLGLTFPSRAKSSS
ncbi:MAG: hypothetical protein JNL79_36270 [Myxococcales bacterium]|nr:hypothetical protein [Myxococcales bacterium]